MKKIPLMALLFVLVISFSCLAAKYVIIDTLLMRRGETVEAEVEVTVPRDPPLVDVVFAIDVTVTMSSTLAKLQSGIETIIAGIVETMPNSDIKWGVVSFGDYPLTYGLGNCGYATPCGDPNAATYGEEEDYAYRLEQALDSNSTLTVTAIQGLSVISGGDLPEAITRALYECGQLSWRLGATKLVYFFSDDVPHDCDLNEDCHEEWGIWSTGGDPGRDEAMGTADDLDLHDVLDGLAANNIKVLFFHSNTDTEDWYDCWASVVSGQFNRYGNSDTVINGTDDEIGDYSEITIEFGPGSVCSDWIFSPSSYADQNIPDEGKDLTFTIDLTMPKDAVCCGECTLNILGDNSIIYSLVINTL